MKNRSRWYVGCNQTLWTPFASNRMPDDLQMYVCRNIYFAVIGPFRTKKAAHIMAHYGRGNPHMQTVADVERIVKQFDNDINEALDAGLARGHVKYDVSMEETCAHFICQSCGRSIVVRMFPMPNEVRIGGEAVALDCKP